jgi:hypothetical protein
VTKGGVRKSKDAISQYVQKVRRDATAFPRTLIGRYWLRREDIQSLKPTKSCRMTRHTAALYIQLLQNALTRDSEIVCLAPCVWEHCYGDAEIDFGQLEAADAHLKDLNKGFRKLLIPVLIEDSSCAFPGFLKVLPKGSGMVSGVWCCVDISSDADLPQLGIRYKTMVFDGYHPTTGLPESHEIDNMRIHEVSVTLSYAELSPKQTRSKVVREIYHRGCRVGMKSAAQLQNMPVHDVRSDEVIHDGVERVSPLCVWEVHHWSDAFVDRSNPRGRHVWPLLRLQRSGSELDGARSAAGGRAQRHQATSLLPRDDDVGAVYGQVGKVAVEHVTSETIGTPWHSHSRPFTCTIHVDPSALLAPSLR